MVMKSSGFWPQHHQCGLSLLLPWLSRLRIVNGCWFLRFVDLSLEDHSKLLGLFNKIARHRIVSFGVFALAFIVLTVSLSHTSNTSHFYAFTRSFTDPLNDSFFSFSLSHSITQVVFQITDRLHMGVSVIVFAVLFDTQHSTTSSWKLV